MRQSSPPDNAHGHSLRLFYALLPENGVRLALANLARDVARETGGRAARAENLHLTLAFLGNVPQERIAELAEIGARAAEAAAPFPLTLDALGVFRDAGVAWAGPQAIPAGLRRVFDVLRASLRAAVLPTERRVFNPHVTLARRCHHGLAATVMEPLDWRVESIALMASETLPEGARYRELASWPLARITPLP
jgi:RNA 2',3'-cyclic 3'-phosphodiesterase